jgi:hypothetical protein
MHTVFIELRLVLSCWARDQTKTQRGEQRSHASYSKSKSCPHLQVAACPCWATLLADFLLWLTLFSGTKR